MRSLSNGLIPVPGNACPCSLWPNLHRTFRIDLTGRPLECLPTFRSRRRRPRLTLTSAWSRTSLPSITLALFMLIPLLCSYTDHHRACSEEFPYFHLPGSLFSQSAQVDHWCQSIPFGQDLLQDLPLTPPDTASDCAISDYADMTSQPWSQASLPEESWTTGQVQDHSTFVQLAGSHWQSQRAAVTIQEMQGLDAAAWPNASHGPVDLGLSPVLSHKSQSSHTLNSLSEPDMSVLPPSLDLSFSAEPSWNPAGSAVYTSSQAMPYSMSGSSFLSAPAQVTYGQHMNTEIGLAAPQSAYPHVHQPVFFPQGGHASYTRPTVSCQPVAHRRPLLPRTESSVVSSQPIYGPQRVLRPQIPGSNGSPSMVSTVSSMPRYAHGASQYTLAATQVPSTVSAPAAQRLPSNVGGASQAIVTPHPEFAAQTRPVGPVGYLSDHTEDWSSFIQFDQEDLPISPTSLRLDQASRCTYQCETDILRSYTSGYGSVPAVTSTVATEDVQPRVAKLEQDANSAFQEPASAVIMPGDNDEGRHRTHPLYNEGPQPDGLYHCPFKGDPTCQHKATKLKCNYEYVTTDRHFVRLNPVY